MAKRPTSKKTTSKKMSPKGEMRDRVKEEKAGFYIVAMGASAGGLDAFASFFKAMPHDSGIAFVIISHLDPNHESLLPELLQKRSKMKVHQVHDGMKVERNQIYVIPPNKDLTILNGILQLMDFSKPRGTNLPIDTFFRALALDQGSNAICIVLSGTGTDGTRGVKAIRDEVGMVMVQDKESAKYDGMPISAISTGLADYVLSPDKMPEQIIKYTQHAVKIIAPAISPFEEATENPLQKIYIILRTRTGHDFSHYKKNTICRRIERRMNVHQIDDIVEYVRHLQTSECEVDTLYKELLIGVTNFFRDSEAFDALRNEYIPRILKNKTDNYSIRVWVPGCATGEEAYSLAIILQECMVQMKRHFNVQIFGTDVDEEAINIARAGLYPESIQTDVSPERLKRYFINEGDGQYRIKMAIREMLVFAPQNVIKDPPFTKLDILSCRNLLIYLDHELQKTLLPIFHYSLKPDGILFLGSSESSGRANDLFTVLNKKWKIFSPQAVNVSSRPILDFPVSPVEFEQVELEVPENIKKAKELSALQLVKTILQQSNTSPCAIIDGDSNVVYIYGRIGRFLEPAEGKVSVNILDMARPGLKSSLALAIRKVAMHKQEIILRDIQVECDDSQLLLCLSVRPIAETPNEHGLMMVVFNEKTTSLKRGKEKQKVEAKEENAKSVEGLEIELQLTKENLQATIEELETSNEELKSTNEELQSTNEELQSTNEELETSKEELQSLNEESTTVNSELQTRIEELSHTNDDMKNLLDSTYIATLFLDLDLCIHGFTPKATDIIPLTGSDSGRPIKHFATSLIDIDLEEYGKMVLKDLKVRELEVQSRNSDIYVMKIRPYRTVNNVIDGVVVTFEDITERKQSEEMLRSLVRSTVGVTGAECFNRIARELSTYLGMECVMVGKIVGIGNISGEMVSALAMVLDEQVVPKYEYTLKGTPCENVMEKGYCFYPQGICEIFPTDNAFIEMNAQAYVGSPLRDKMGRAIGILCAVSRDKVDEKKEWKDVIEILAARASAEIVRKQAEDELRTSEAHLQAILNYSPVLISTRDPDGKVTLANQHFEVLNGPPLEEIVGKNIHNFSPYDIADTLWISDDVEASKVPLQMEEQARHKDGTIHDYFTHKFPLIDEKDTLLGTGAISVDITDRKQAERKLSDTNQLLEAIIEQSSVPMVVVTPDGTLKVYNDAFQDLMAFEDESNIKPGVNIRDTVPSWKIYDSNGHYISCEELAMPRALEGKSTVDMEVRIVRKDGTERWGVMTGVPIYNNEAELIAGLVVFPDISERKQMEESLRKSKEKYRILFDLASDSIVLADAQTLAIKECNEIVCKDLGYTRDEFLQLKIPDIEAVESEKDTADHAKKVIDHGMDVFETKMKCKNGDIRDVIVKEKAISIGGNNFILSTWQNNQKK